MFLLMARGSGVYILLKSEFPAVGIERFRNSDAISFVVRANSTVVRNSQSGICIGSLSLSVGTLAHLSAATALNFSSKTNLTVYQVLNTQR